MATTISVKVNKNQTYGQALTKAGVSNPVRANYNFAGWNTKADGTGETRTPGQEVVKSETIYAQWSAVTYTVYFDLDGGNRIGGGQLTQTVAHGGNAIPPTCTKTGYTLSGWDGSYTNVTSDRTITAIWVVATFTVVFNLDGGTYAGGAPLEQVINYGGTAIAPNDPEKTGYVFNGWSGNYTYVTSNRTITALWISDKPNNLIYQFGGSANWGVRTTSAATSNLTIVVNVLNVALQEYEDREFTISSGQTNSETVSGSFYVFNNIVSVNPDEDSNYYYVF